MTAIRSKALRNAARGQHCALQFPGICNHDPETTVLAHLHDGRQGRGIKADDTSAVHACSACHAALDEHRTGLSDEVLSKALLRALQATIRRLVLDGVLSVPLDPPPKPQTIKRKPKSQRTKIPSRPFQRTNQ